jgi:hypothetical protein
MLFAYLTLDEVCQDLAQRLAGAHGVELDVLSFRDAAPNGQFDAVLHDLDSLPADRREAILSDLLAGPAPGPVAVHSYNLRGSQIKALRTRGVLVTRRLNPQVFVLLRRAVENRARARPGLDPEESWA